MVDDLIRLKPPEMATCWLNICGNLASSDPHGWIYFCYARQRIQRHCAIRSGSTARHGGRRAYSVGLVMVVKMRPLSPALGAEVAGVDLNKGLDHDTFAAIYQAFLDYQVLVFRGQNLNPGAHVTVARRFGKVQVHVLNQYHADSHPELFVLSNLDDNGQPNGRHPDLGTLEWHTDG